MTKDSRRAAGLSGWGETVAAYRFFDNDEVQWAAVLEPHWRQTEQRMAAHSVVLCLQDTTELNFNGQQAAGLGALSYEAQRCRDLDAELFFEADEIRGVYLSLTSSSRPSPSLTKCCAWIARQGGFLGHKSDKEPGAKAF